VCCAIIGPHFTAHNQTRLQLSFFNAINTHMLITRMMPPREKSYNISWRKKMRRLTKLHAAALADDGGATFSFSQRAADLHNLLVRLPVIKAMLEQLAPVIRTSRAVANLVIAN
jgi:hypothetical protein